MMENDFSRACSKHIKCELRVDGATFPKAVHWTNAQVERQASEVGTLKTAFTNCFKMTHNSSKKRSDIILSTESTR